MISPLLGSVRYFRSLVQLQWFQLVYLPQFHVSSKIREIEEDIPIETTEVVRGIENIVRNQVEGLSFTKVQHDACVDHTFPASLLSSKMVWDKCLELNR